SRFAGDRECPAAWHGRARARATRRLRRATSHFFTIGEPARNKPLRASRVRHAGRRRGRRSWQASCARESKEDEMKRLGTIFVVAALWGCGASNAQSGAGTSSAVSASAASGGSAADSGVDCGLRNARVGRASSPLKGEAMRKGPAKTRRELLKALGTGFGAAVLFRCGGADATSAGTSDAGTSDAGTGGACVLDPTLTKGPYWVD